MPCFRATWFDGRRLIVRLALNDKSYSSSNSMMPALSTTLFTHGAAISSVAFLINVLRSPLFYMHMFYCTPSTGNAGIQSLPERLVYAMLAPRLRQRFHFGIGGSRFISMK